MGFKEPERNRAAIAEWRRKYPERVKEQSRHFGALKKERLTRRRETLLDSQGGVCAICGTDDPGQAQGWHLDHDHLCCSGKAREACGQCDRGVLCRRCNVMVVPVVENRDLLKKARRYLGHRSLRRLVEQGGSK